MITALSVAGNSSPKRFVANCARSSFRVGSRLAEVPTQRIFPCGTCKRVLSFRSRNATSIAWAPVYVWISSNTSQRTSALSSSGRLRGSKRMCSSIA